MRTRGSIKRERLAAQKSATDPTKPIEDIDHNVEETRDTPNVQDTINRIRGRGARGTGLQNRPSLDVNNRPLSGDVAPRGAGRIRGTGLERNAARLDTILVRPKERDSKTSLSEQGTDRGDGTAISNSGSFEKSNPLELEPADDLNPGIPENVLNQFTSTQYHITLSLLPADEAIRAQNEMARGNRDSEKRRSDSLQEELFNSRAVVLASTGDEFKEPQGVSDNRDIDNSSRNGEEIRNLGNELNLEGKARGINYFNIRSARFDTYIAPTKENPFITQMALMTMQLAEPHGFKFVENIRTLANRLGYEDVHTSRLVYRVDIFFSGYDENGVWVPRINLNNHTALVEDKITYYLSLVKVKANVEHTGTIYDLEFATAAHAAYRPEELTLEADSILTDSSGEGGPINFGSFLDNLSEALNNAKRERTNGMITRKYEFIAPKKLRDASFYAQEFTNIKNFTRTSEQGGMVIPIGKDTDILMILEAALKDLPFVQESFLREQDTKFSKPRIHWGVRFNAIYDKSTSSKKSRNERNAGSERTASNLSDSRLHDVSGIKLQYIIEPFATFRKATIENMTKAEQVVESLAQKDRLLEMVRLGMINRIYNYIHTSQNTEIIDFNVELNGFYFQTLDTTNDNPTTAGSGTREAVGDVVEQRQDKGITADNIQTIDEIRRQEINRNRTLRDIFGSDFIRPANCADTDIRSAGDILGGGFQEYPKSQATSSISSAAQKQKSRYELNIRDHLELDLIKTEMTVRGDPSWLLSSYAVNPRNNVKPLTAVGKNTIGSRIVDANTSKYYFLNFKEPFQDDFINPNRKEASSACGYIGGFYELIQVTNQFDNGKFTQVITATKVNHLNFVDRHFDVNVLKQTDTEEMADSSLNVPQRNEKPS